MQHTRTATSLRSPPTSPFRRHTNNPSMLQQQQNNHSSNAVNSTGAICPCGERRANMQCEQSPHRCANCCRKMMEQRKCRLRCAVHHHYTIKHFKIRAQQVLQLQQLQEHQENVQKSGQEHDIICIDDDDSEHEKMLRQRALPVPTAPTPQLVAHADPHTKSAAMPIEASAKMQVISINEQGSAIQGRKIISKRLMRNRRTGEVIQVLIVR